MAAFSITSAQPSARLPITRHGRLDFTVTNIAHRELTARAHVVPEGTAKVEWFTIVGPQRDSPPDATHQFGVQVAVPIAAPPGPYRFRLDVVGVEDPDEYEGEGVWATIDVPPAPRPSRVPLWILAAAAVLLVAILVGVYFRFIRQPPRPNLEVSATVQAFGSIPVGQGSPGSVVMIKNTGSADARVSATLVGANAADFKVLASTCAGQALTAGSSCQLQVGFQPSAQGTRAATLVVKAPNAPTPPALTMTGTGQGTSAAVTFSPPTVALTQLPNFFGIGDVPVATVVTIKNNGGTPFTIASVKLVEDDLAGAFQLVSGCENVQLAGGQSCQVAIVFSHARGPGSNTYTGQLQVLDNALGPASIQTVHLTGNRF
jgi:hypothetical protein